MPARSVCLLIELGVICAALKASQRNGSRDDTAVASGKPRVYFMLQEYEDSRRANYQHMPVALAEGLTATGYYFRANVNYWQAANTSDYLFKSTTEDPLAFDAIVAPYKMAPVLWGNITEARKRNGRPQLVVLDWGDGKHAFMNKSLPYDVYYRASYATALLPESPQKPLLISAMYLTNRMLKAADAAASRAKRAHSERQYKYMWPHAEHMHAVRKYMRDHFLGRLPADMIAKTAHHEMTATSADFFYWSATGRRHDSFYYDTMQEAQVMDCTAGHWLHDKIYQWDSLKLWEALASGIATMLPDLDLYGLKLPVMPVKFQHYIPVVLEDDFLEMLAYNFTARDFDFKKIGKAGREWAMLHYSPTAFAHRFVGDVFPPRRRSKL